MTRPDWLNELEALAQRCSHLGVLDDLPSLTRAEAWALLLRLRREAARDGAQ